MQWLQVLVASEDQKKQKSGEEDKKKTSSSSKDIKSKDHSESHVEMDSRILSALLTVSILFVFLFILIRNKSHSCMKFSKWVTEDSQVGQGDSILVIFLKL